MKFRFKIQKYQTEAVKAITDVFKGQPYISHAKYTMDMGERQPQLQQSFLEDKNIVEDYDMGFANAKVELSANKILENIKEII